MLNQTGETSTAMQEKEEAPGLDWGGVTIAPGALVSKPPTPLEQEVLRTAIACDVKALLSFLCHPESVYMQQRTVACEYRNVAPSPWFLDTSNQGAIKLAPKAFMS